MFFFFVIRQYENTVGVMKVPVAWNKLIGKANTKLKAGTYTFSFNIVMYVVHCYSDNY